MENAVYCATKTLIDNNIKSLPILQDTIIEIINNQGFKVIGFNMPLDDNDRYDFERLGIIANAERYQGFAYSKDDMKYIFFRSDLSQQDKIHVLAHELGHIMLGHLSVENALQGYDFGNDEKQEQEADRFALEFLAPSCVLRQIQSVTVDDICSITLLNKEYAEKALINVYEHNSNKVLEHVLCKKFEMPSTVRKISKSSIIKFISMFAVLIALISAMCWGYVTLNNKIQYIENHLSEQTK